MGNLIKATIEIIDGVIWLTCHKCGYRWRPRKPDPVECPNCKVHLIVTEMMQEKIKEKHEPDEVTDVREIVPEFFTAQCAIEGCGEAAAAKFKGKLLCGIHLIGAMKESGVLKDV